MFRKLLTVLFLTASLPSFADRTYVEMGFEAEVFDDLSFAVSPEWRNDPEKEEQQFHTDLSFGYEIFKNWEVTGTYRKGKVFYESDDSSEVERFAFSTSYTWKIDNFRIQTRLRHTNGTDDDGDEKEYLRYRLKIDYEIDALDLRPFLAYEKYDSLEADESRNPNVYSGGISWKINKQNQLRMEYRWVDKIHSRKDYGVYKLTYQFDF